MDQEQHPKFEAILIQGDSDEIPDPCRRLHSVLPVLR